MQILITGSKGFIGKNLIAELWNRSYNDIYEITRETETKQYDYYCSHTSFVFHLLGVNRTDDVADFVKGNYNETKKLVDTLKKHGCKAPILYASSIQAELDNPYGKSKLAAEELLLDYADKQGIRLYIYRLPNVFGKWSRPDYNSAISTFCYRIARDMPIDINDSGKELQLAYIDDVVNEFINKMRDGYTKEYINNEDTVKESEDNNYHRYQVQISYKARLGDIVDILREFYEMRIKKRVPDISDIFIRKLYSTYISYLPKDGFSNIIEKNSDNRGSFIELLKLTDQGQISVNIIKPGMKKGGHWHHTKNEKFFVIQGYGVIIFKKVNDDNSIEYKVNSDIPEAVDIPTGYMHTIINHSDIDMIVIIWADEIYNPKQPDTYS